MLSDRLFGLFSSDLAIDLGTANTLVFVRGRGIVLNEPSIIAIRRTDNEVIGVGHEAKAMLGRTPENIQALRPLKDGVIADFDVTERMLQYFIERARQISSGRKRAWVLDRPRVVVGVPSGITQVEKRAVRDAALQAGARDVYLIEEPTAAAIGAGIPIHEPGGHLVVDIGGGTTEVAVISMTGTVYCNSVRIAGDEMDEAIIQHIRKHYRLLVGERRAEEIKIALGSAHPEALERSSIEVKGRDLVDGVPKTLVITDEEIRDVPRADAAGAGGRHHREGRGADGRRRAPTRDGLATAARDSAARPRRRRSVELRRARRRHGARRCRAPEKSRDPRLTP
jgi:rod shape-determining protein MreB